MQTYATMDASHHSDIAHWEVLEELDPSPIDSPDSEEWVDPLTREDNKHELAEIVKDRAGTETRSPPSHALGLSGLGGSHGAVYYCAYLSRRT